MTAPLFWLDGGVLAAARPGAVLVLDGPEGRHAATVRRIGPGEPVDVADGAGRAARCTVVSAGRDALELAVTAVDDEPLPGLRLTLVQALAKGGRDELAVEAATEVGVDAVVPWQAERSVVVWRGERGARARSKWGETARTAAKQSRRSRVPEVEALLTTAELVDRAARPGTRAVVLHEDAADPLSAVPIPAEGELLLVVGPEGGIAPGELEVLRAAGADVVRLGPHVLRSSTAGVAALVTLAVRSGRW